MLILTQQDPLFDHNRVKEMYDKHFGDLNENCTFEEALKHSHFYSFYVDKKLIGCIYFYLVEGKLFVNAFAGRKTHNLNIECFKKSISFYDCDINARTNKKMAIYCILKCGFEKIDDNLYKYERS